MDNKKQFYSSAIESFTHFEFENNLNGKVNPEIKIGEELIIADFLILRSGIVSDGYSASGRDTDLQVTFGAGLKIGLNKFFKTEKNINLILDYAGTPPTTDNSNNHFDILSLKVNYTP